jgi:hypothetical protein
MRKDPRGAVPVTPRCSVSTRRRFCSLLTFCESISCSCALIFRTSGAVGCNNPSTNAIRPAFKHKEGMKSGETGEFNSVGIREAEE